MLRTQLSVSDVKDIFNENLRKTIPGVVYKIVWIGPLSISVSSDPHFKIFLIDEDESAAIVAADLPFSLFRLVSPGTLIKDRKLFFGKRRESQFLETFIQDATLKRVTYHEVFGVSNVIGLGYDTELSKIPFLLWHSNVQVHLGQVTVDRKCTFLIPESEMIKFYYFPSSRLQSVAISPAPLDSRNNLLYLPSSVSDIDAPVKGIVIRDSMLIRDVPTIARIAYSIEARQGFSEISASVARGLARQADKVYLTSRLPFTGQTKWHLKGKFLDMKYISSSFDNVFLVDEILSCTAKFPFTQLLFDRETSLNKKYSDKSIEQIVLAESVDGVDKLSAKRVLNLYYPKFAGLGNVNNSVETNSRALKVKILTQASRFVSLPDDIQRMSDRQRDIFNEKLHVHKIPTVDPYITTNPNKTSNGGGVNAETTSINVQASGLLENFMVDLRKYLVSRGVDFFTPPKQNEFFLGNGEQENLRIDFKDNIKDDQTKFAFGDSGLPRQLSCIPGRINNFHFLVIEFEPKGGRPSSLRIFFKLAFNDTHDGAIMSSDDIVEILDDLAVNGGELPSTKFEMIKCNHVNEVRSGTQLILDVQKRGEVILRKITKRIGSLDKD